MTEIIAAMHSMVIKPGVAWVIVVFLKIIKKIIAVFTKLSVALKTT